MIFTSRPFESCSIFSLTVFPISYLHCFVLSFETSSHNLPMLGHSLFCKPSLPSLSFTSFLKPRDFRIPPVPPWEYFQAPNSFHHQLLFPSFVISPADARDGSAYIFPDEAISGFSVYIASSFFLHANFLLFPCQHNHRLSNGFH